MWLLPLLHRLTLLPARVYYRITLAGDAVPPSDPVLLVANHPNSLFDPALVAAVAGRPVRFLAKEPLLFDPVVGWLVRGAGSIPIYRAQDDPGSVTRNQEAFRAAHEALRDGSALGIFPEGITHHLPALAPLKTGAARIALGAAALRGAAFPIVPVGLSFRDKERFRSEGLVRVGPPVEWADLAHPGYGGREVRELTRRIDDALRALTLNLGSWEDEPLVRWAAAIHVAEFGAPEDPVLRAAAEQEAVEVLGAARARGPGWEAVARRVRSHAAEMEALELRPADLHAPLSRGVALRRTLRTGAVLLLTGAAALLGRVLFLPAQWVTDRVILRMNPTPDVRSTYRTIAGAVFFPAWTVVLALAAGVAVGWRAGVVAQLALPAVAVLGLLAQDRWSSARGTARRFLLLRTREPLLRDLARRQREIALRLAALRQRPRTPPPAMPPATPLT
jgi:glycerol-3-phosphate O-acyltransferase / dihydroxyacetone phosphate acyltransferase